MAKSTAIIAGKVAAGVLVTAAVGTGVYTAQNHQKSEAPTDASTKKVSLGESSVSKAISDSQNSSNSTDSKNSTTQQAATPQTGRPAATPETIKANTARNQARAKAETAQKQNAANKSTVQVKAGDTLWGLASKHGVSLNDLLNANPNIRKDGTIHVGQTVNIPGKTNTSGSHSTGSNSGSHSTGSNTGSSNGSHSNGSSNGTSQADKDKAAADKAAADKAAAEKAEAEKAAAEKAEAEKAAAEKATTEASKSQSAKDAAALVQSTLATSTQASKDLADANLNLDSAKVTLSETESLAAQADQAAKDAQAVADAKTNAQTEADAAAVAAQAAKDAAVTEGVQEKIDAAQVAVDAANAAKAEAEQAVMDAVAKSNEAVLVAQNAESTAQQAKDALAEAQTAVNTAAAKAQVAKDAATAAQAALDAANAAKETATTEKQNADDALQNAKDVHQIRNTNTTNVYVDESGNTVEDTTGYKEISSSKTNSVETPVDGVDGLYDVTETVTHVMHKIVTTHVTVNVDQSGNRLTDVSDATLISTHEDSDTAENGDITITTINTYHVHTTVYETRNYDENGVEITPNSTDYVKVGDAEVTTKKKANGDTLQLTVQNWRKITRTETVVNVDEDGKDLGATVNSSDYVLVNTTSDSVTAENGDVHTTTTKVWHKMSERDVVISVDEFGKTVTPSDKYKLISTTSETKVVDNVKVTTITNVYHEIQTTVVVTNVDEAGNVIESTNGYYKILEEADPSKTIVAENGDLTTFTTYTWHKMETIEVTVNVDESGKAITSTDGYSYVSKSEAVKSTASNGDTILTTKVVWHKIVTNTVTVNVDESGKTISSTDGYFMTGLMQASKTASNGDITVTITQTWHKVVESNVTVNITDKGETLTGTVDTSKYVKVSSTTSTDVAANGDKVNTTTITWHEIGKYAVTVNVEDKNNSVITDTTGLVLVSESSVDTVDEATGDITTTTTKIWHAPVRLGSKDGYTLDGKTADPNTIDSQFDWITVVGETSVKTNVQANGDYTEVFISQYQSRTISQSEFQTLFSDMMTAALIQQKKELVEMYPIDAEYMLKTTMTAMTAEEDKGMGGDAQQAVDNCVIAGKLYHNSYGSYQAQNIAKVGTNPVAGYTYATAKYIVETVIKMNWLEKDALDASKYGPGYTAFNEDNGHLYNVLYSQKVFSAINYDAATNTAYIAMNFL